MEEQVEDIAGIRIICQFVEDIEKVADLIQKRSDIEIKSEKDYIRHMKDSGYRSYHLIVYYTVETMNYSEAHPGGNPDPHDGDGFLGDD